MLYSTPPYEIDQTENKTKKAIDKALKVSTTGKNID